MWPFGVVVRDPFFNPGACFRTGFKCIEIDALVFQGTPKPFYQSVVRCPAVEFAEFDERGPPTFPVHALPGSACLHARERGYLYVRIFQRIRPFKPSELTALIAVHYRWFPIFCDGLFQGFNTKVSLHAVGQSPTENFTAEPVHDRDQIQKSAPHRNVGDINAPDLIWPINRQPPEQVRVNLMLRVFLARVWRLIDWNQAHKPHQAAHTMATAFVTLPLHIPLLLDTYYCSNRKSPEDGGRSRMEPYKQESLCRQATSWTGMMDVLQNRFKRAFRAVCPILGHLSLQIILTSLRGL